MIMKVGSLMVVLVMMLGMVTARGSGNIGELCNDASITPRHGFSFQTSESSPYTITVTQLNNNDYQVIIDGTRDFKGFMVQSRKAGIRVGNFGVVSRSRVHSQGCVSHSDPSKKSSITLPWNKGSTTGTVTFKATVLESYDKYWTIQTDYTI